jgi:hypothetical protein
MEEHVVRGDHVSWATAFISTLFERGDTKPNHMRLGQSAMRPEGPAFSSRVRQVAVPRL